MKKLIISIAILVFVIIIGWLWIESTKPLPGIEIPDEGRDHIKVGEEVVYKTNPPTSGKHYEDWIKAGIYEINPDDRYLLHSLEHGYVIMSYNCSFEQKGMVRSVEAHGLPWLDTASSSANEASTSAEKLPKEFRTDSCHKLLDSLIAIYEKKGKTKLIIVPRSTLDARIALTAWRRIDKFNPSVSSGLSDQEKGRIEKFIDAHRDHGPEKTMEP